MSNPFKKISKTSESTKKKWDSEVLDSAMDAKQCHACGAPRPIRTNLVQCAYCGTPFMNLSLDVKPDA